ncbi:MAG TPA: TspO/MBR family protein [Bacteroidia bacterium]|nr:TspO/MBR family protein [Bacteroidia bacterium]
MIISKNISSGWKLLISILVCEAVGFISGLLSIAEIRTWFSTLNVPEWNPPSYLFGPVWTFLYFTLGVSFWLLWKKDIPSQTKSKAQLLFLIQLFSNFLWSILFFTFHSPFLALVDIALMIVITLFIILYFMRISQAAALLLIPYISWISFAAVLNYNIWYLNK